MKREEIIEQLIENLLIYKQRFRGVEFTNEETLNIINVLAMLAEVAVTRNRVKPEKNTVPVTFENGKEELHIQRTYWGNREP